jgi:acetoacetyl-CoA synthetase
MNKPLWKPSTQIKQESLLEDFSKFINIDSSHNFERLWEWSVTNQEEFWSKFWDYSKIIGDKGKEIIRKKKNF